MLRARWVVAIAAGCALLRTELPIRLIRAVDQRLALLRASLRTSVLPAGSP